jgi:hypothetical protein
VSPVVRIGEGREAFMATVFENATRAAIEEILQNKLHNSKHGFVLTKEGYKDLVDELYGFLKASRNLKEAGDRLLGGMSRTSATAGTRS